MYASLFSLVDIHILVHHVPHCSYSPGPLSQLFNTAHKNWVVCNIKKLAIGFKILCWLTLALLSLLLLGYSAPYKAVLHCFLQVYACTS